MSRRGANERQIDGVSDVRFSVVVCQCMVYLPTCGIFFMVNVGEYTIH